MRLRAPSHEDALAVLGVVVARDVIDLGMPDYALEDIYDAWGVSSFDLAVDAVIAETDEGAIAGYAAVEPKGTMVVVAPEHEGSGVGTRLLEWAERRDRELGRRRHRQGIAAGNSQAGLDRAQLGVASDNPDALRLYERCGMSPRFTVETYERPVRPEGD